MTFPNPVTDPEAAVASGELVLAQYLPSLPRFPSSGFDGSLTDDTSSLPLKMESSGNLPYNSFLIPNNSQPVSPPKTKQLSRWGRLQLWFNTYRYNSSAH